MNMNDILEAKEYTHDELIEMVFKQYHLSDKNKLVSLFLSSFSTHKLEWRSSLPVYAIMQTFPKHNLTLRYGLTSELANCRICSAPAHTELDDEWINIINDCFYKVGGVINRLFYYQFFLNESNKMDPQQPIGEDFRIFSEIIDILLDADEKDTVKKIISSKINKIKGFKSNAAQRQVLLETLGYCSILETPKHKGLLKQYININTTPRKTHSSDWNYPVDFWLGKNGINKEAFKFWFGSYPELKKYWK